MERKVRRANKKFWYKKVVNIPMYPVTLDIIFTNDSPKLTKLVGKKMGDIYGEVVTNGNCVAIAINFWGEYPIVHGVISHEAYHAAAYIMEYIGQKYDWRTEAFTYLLDWIVDETYNFAEKLNIKIITENKARLK